MPILILLKMKQSNRSNASNTSNNTISYAHPKSITNRSDSNTNRKPNNTATIKKKPATTNRTNRTNKSNSNLNTISSRTSKSKDKTSNRSNQSKPSTAKSKKPKAPLSTVSTSEVKITKNIDTINRLIGKSSDILSEQNSLLEKYGEITKKVTSSDFEIERLLNKSENDDFNIFVEKYGSNLNSLLQRLKLHSEEVEEIKCKII